MTDQLILTTVQRDAQIEALTNSKEAIATSLHFGVDEVQAASDISSLNAAIDMLQSLPMVSGEPVAWQMKSLFSSNKWVGVTKAQCEAAEETDAYTQEPRAIHTRRLYTSPQALKPITAKDVTDEMHETFDKTFMPYGPDREIMAAAYNAVIKHKGDTK